MINYGQIALEKCEAQNITKYEYLDTFVENKKRKILVCCHEKDENGEEHGRFVVNYDKHIHHGLGCPKCSNKQKVTFERAIKEGDRKHNCKYEYLKLFYVKEKPFIECVCHEKDDNGKEHGNFKVNFHKHINRGDGCPKCRYIQSGLSQRKNDDLFRKQLKVLHPTKEYNILDKYVTDKTPIRLYCFNKDKNGNEHGIFTNTPNNLLNSFHNQWCPKCGRENTIEAHTYSLEKWIDLANKKHNKKYVYDTNLNYIDSQHKVNILCPKHGYFSMVARNHLYGQGCPICNESKLEIEIANFLQEKNITFERQKHFEWLGRQSIDFYLPQYNVGIECQGKQHFDIGGWGESFNAIKERDERKRRLCEENNIKLLYYSNLGINYPYNVYEDKNGLLNLIKKDEIRNIN